MNEITEFKQAQEITARSMARNWYEIGEVGLTFANRGRPVGKEAYRKAGAVFTRASTAMKWALADWLLYGEEAYDQDWPQLISHLDLSHGYVANIMSVARRFPIEDRRREGYDKDGIYLKPVPFSVYQAIRPLDREHRESILDAWQYGKYENREQVRFDVKKLRATNPNDEEEKPPKPTELQLHDLVCAYVDAFEAGTQDLAALYVMMKEYRDETRRDRESRSE